MTKTITFNDLRPHAVGQAGLMESIYQRVIRSGRYIGGDEVEAFEHDWAVYCDKKYCVSVGNGFDALYLLLLAYGIGKGDVVAVPSWTCVPVWQSVIMTGASVWAVEPVFPEYNISPSSMYDCFIDKTRAAIFVHMYGIPVVTLTEKLHKEGIRVIEDASQAQGAMTRFGYMVGTYADATIYSFYPTKNLGAFGDAGAITTDDYILAKRLRKMRRYGSKRSINSCLDPLQAAFLDEKIYHLDEWNDRRREIAAEYLRSFVDLPYMTLPVVPEMSSPVWHQFVIRHTQRERFRQYLKDNGIETMIHYPQAPHQFYRLKIKLPVAEQLAREVVSLPIGPHLSNDDVNYIIEIVRNFV